MLLHACTYNPYFKTRNQAHKYQLELETKAPASSQNSSFRLFRMWPPTKSTPDLYQFQCCSNTGICRPEGDVCLMCPLCYKVGQANKGKTFTMVVQCMVGKVKKEKETAASSPFAFRGMMRLVCARCTRKMMIKKAEGQQPGDAKKLKDAISLERTRRSAKLWMHCVNSAKLAAIMIHSQTWFMNMLGCSGFHTHPQSKMGVGKNQNMWRVKMKRRGNTRSGHAALMNAKRKG